jgi:hypothetical protein
MRFHLPYGNNTSDVISIVLCGISGRTYRFTHTCFCIATLVHLVIRRGKDIAMRMGASKDGVLIGNRMYWTL